MTRKEKRRMKRNNLIRNSLLIVMFLAATGMRADSIPERLVADDDSVSYELPRPKDFDATRFSLDTHHRYMGDFMGRGVNFIDFGAGLQLINHINSNHTEPFTTLHLRFGRQFSPLHSARIGINGGIGYILAGADGTGAQTLTGSYGAEADYLFSLSSYLLGYRPERALNVSPFIGIGVDHTFIGGGHNKTTAYDLKESATSYNVHAGLQLKLFAGPKAALTIEPFVQLNSTGIDLSDQGSNWHKYHVSYGLNLSYYYYFHNTLTPLSQQGDFKRRFGDGQRWLQGSSQDKAQRRPLFFHYGAGIATYNTFDNLRWAKTVGPTFSVGFGGWLSSAIGLRTVIHAANSSWAEVDDRTNMMGYVSMSIDALLNPLGFTRNFSWEAPAGLTLVAGYEAGLLKMVNSGSRNRSNVMGYHLGIQPWVRLGHDTRLFIEPMYAFLLHRQEEENRKRDDQLTLKAGIELLLGNRQDDRSESANLLQPNGYFIGAGGGWNTTVRKWHYTDYTASFLKNGTVFAGYHFNENSGVMLSGEYLTDAIRLDSGDEHRWKNWMLSADYQLNLSNFFTGYQPHRRWTLTAMAGPTVALNSEKTRIGANLGFMIDYRFAKHLALFFQHRFYWMDKNLYVSDQLYNQGGTFISSMNMGLMYMFDDLVGPTTRIAKGAARGISKLFQQERSPFFLDYGYGLAWFPGMPAKATDTFGSSLQVSFGWWMLPSVGARIGAFASKGGAICIPASQAGNVSDVITSVGSAGLFADLLVNPLGFVSHYDWSQRFGVNLIGGFQRGIFAVEGHNSEARGRNLYANGLRAGMQLWVKLQDDLRLHVEPLYTHMSCDEIFIDDETNSRVRRYEAGGFSMLDAKQAMSVRVGLTALLRNPKKRDNGNYGIFDGPRWTVAAGGGWNFNLNKWSYDDSGLNFNGLVSASYRLNGYHSLRAQFEYVSDDVAEEGQKSERTNLHFTSVDYMIDMTTVLGGYNSQRPWMVALFAGPSLDNSQSLGLNLGLTAGYRFDDHWGVFYNHNAYLFTIFNDHKLFTTEQISSRVSTLNTFNLGVAYHF